MANPKIKPAVILKVGEPDQKAQVLSHGAAMHFDFRADAERLSDRQMQLATEPSWEYDGAAIASPAYPVLTLEPEYAWPHMDLGEWGCSPPEKWATPLTPKNPGPRRHIWYYDSRPNQIGVAQSTFIVPAHPQFHFSWYDYAAPEGQTADVYTEITLRAGEDDAVTLVLPIKHSFHKHPVLIKEGNIIDEFQGAVMDAAFLNDGPIWNNLVFRNLPGATVIAFELGSADWVTRVLGHSLEEYIKAGTLTVTAAGHALLFYLQACKFPTNGYAASKWIEDWDPAFVPPLTSFTVPEDVYDYTPPAGTYSNTTVTDFSGAGGPYQVNLTLHTDDPLQTPVVGWTGIYGDTTIADPLADSYLKDLTEAGDLYRVEWRIRDSYRGSVLKATLRDWDNKYAWKGNNWVEFSVAWDDGTGRDSLTYYDQFAGFLDRPRMRRRIREDIGQKNITLRARDWFYRLEKKPTFMFPAFGGWNFGAAVRYILHRCGVPDSLIEIPSSLEEDTVIVPWDDAAVASYRYDDDGSVIKLLDRLCNAVARSVSGYQPHGIYVYSMPTGKLRIWPGITYAEEDEKLQIDSGSVGDDLVLRFDQERGIDDFRNHVVVVGKKKQALKRTWMRDIDSQFTRADEKFIGDDWWEVRVDTDIDNPEARVNALYKDRRHLSTTIRWKTRGHPELMPNDFVRVDGMEGSDIPIGTIFRITEKRSEIELDSLRWETTFFAEMIDQ